MKVTESTAELRRICQQSRQNEFFQTPWLERYTTRSISIYFTRLFLTMGISANQTTLIALIIWIGGGVLLLLPDPGHWLMGLALLWLGDVFGRVDGEVARYNKTSSLKGAFWGSIAEQVIVLFMPICMSFGVYRNFPSVFPFIVGFAGVMGLYLNGWALLLPYPVIREKGMLSEFLATDNPKEFRLRESRVLKLGHLIAHFSFLLIVFLVASVVDLFAAPFAVGSFSFDLRYVGLAGYALLWLAGSFWNISLSLRHGLRLRL